MMSAVGGVFAAFGVLSVALLHFFFVLKWLAEPLVAARARAKDEEVDEAERRRWLSESRTPSPRLSIVIPAYNEASRLPSMLGSVASYLKASGRVRTTEILVISDGSTDETSAVAAAVGEGLNLRVVDLATNRGKGGAVREGARRARGDYVLVADADGATKFDDVERLERRAAATARPVIVVGSRAHLQGDAVATRSPLRNCLMRGFHLVVRVVGGVRNVRDTQCGFKLLSKKAVPLLAAIRLERWAFDVELLFLAQRLGVPILEVPVTWTEVPGSKLSILKDSLQMARDIACFRLAYAANLWHLPTTIGTTTEVLEQDNANNIVSKNRKTTKKSH
mmetsp:Transcript_22258/g.71741  ORF Transcript_22258/g.71741 Transcript_22258/m.71741 type:complete len:336 (+) Transcript_22258:47-1054(+)